VNAGPALPVWLLDFDGVINASRPGWPGVIPRSGWACADGLREFRIRWNPVLVGRIEALIGHERVDVRWCSSWCGQTEQLEHLIGLPRLQDAITVPDGGYTGDVKLAAALAVRKSGRRLIWTDDTEVPVSGPDYDRLAAGGGGLLIRPSSSRGLRPQDMDAIEAFCRGPE